MPRRLASSAPLLSESGEVEPGFANGSADDFDPLVFRLAVGIDLDVHRHAEEVEILRHFAGDAKAGSLVFFGLLLGLTFLFCRGGAAQAVGGVLQLELWRAG